MTFSPTPRTQHGFIEHVSKDIVKNITTPEDFEASLWYVLYQLPERNRDIFLKVERDNTPVRVVGLEYGVSGQRIFDLNKETKANMLSFWGEILSKGVMQYTKDTADVAREYGEKNASVIAYKRGYTEGYSDGSKNKLQRHYATEEFDGISLSDLTLSYRTQHYLFDNNLLSVSQIIECGDNIMKIHNLGKKSLEELITRLKDFGVNVTRYFPATINKYDINVEE